jgi:hypothetical protein
MSIVATHRVVLGEIAKYTLCVAFPSGLLEGMIVLEGFCWELVTSEPGSTYDNEIGSK